MQITAIDVHASDERLVVTTAKPILSHRHIWKDGTVHYECDHGLTGYHVNVLQQQQRKHKPPFNAYVSINIMNYGTYEYVRASLRQFVSLDPHRRK